MDKKTEEFYERLRNELDLNNTWPAEYLYKFIVPSETEKIEQVQKAFDDMGAVVSTRQSKTGKFTSISVNVRMNDALHVISKYKQLSDIEGIISL